MALRFSRCYSRHVCNKSTIRPTKRMINNVDNQLFQCRNRKALHNLSSQTFPEDPGRKNVPRRINNTSFHFGNQVRLIITSSNTTLGSSRGVKSSNNDIKASKETQIMQDMDNSTLYELLDLRTFSDLEIDQVIAEIISSSPTSNESQTITNDELINHELLTNFLCKKFKNFDTQLYSLEEHHQPKKSYEMNMDDDKHSSIKLYALQEASRVLNMFRSVSEQCNCEKESTDSPHIPSHKLTISASQFKKHICDLSSSSSPADKKLLIPLSLSMLLVGSSVGVLNPVMPFIVKSLGLTTGQYGMVVSSFGFAKMIGNVPSAIFAEKYGRKPFMVNSLLLIGSAVGGISIASSLEHLIACRLLTGFGVAALSTSATLVIADISTPRNRASQMAPIMSAFAAGMCVGPAIGGELADSLGVRPSFAVVGLSYMAIAVFNSLLLSETKRKELPIGASGIPSYLFLDGKLPWANKEYTINQSSPSENEGRSKKSSSLLTSMVTEMKEVFSQQVDLLSDSRMRNIVIINGCYMLALAGSQMTLLPLLLTSSEFGDAMNASSVGSVYMGMSLVQVIANPVVGKFVDRVGKRKSIAGGMALMGLSMSSLPNVLIMSADLPSSSGSYALTSVMGLWALGGTFLATSPVALVSDIVTDKRRAQAIALLRTAGVFRYVSF